jgi:hypothetical protein
MTSSPPGSGPTPRPPEEAGPGAGAEEPRKGGPPDPAAPGEPRGRPLDPEGSRGPLGSGTLHPEVRRRVSLAVRAGEAVADPADAPAAVELARLAQRRIQDRALPNALRISGGMVLVWLILVAVPVTISTGLHLAAIAAGLGIGLLLFSVIVLLGRRQLRLARQAEQRNLRLLEQGRP